MAGFKITVLRKMANHDLVDEYCQPDVDVPCPHFDDGQEFLIDDHQMPEGFCVWAWNDIRKVYLTLRFGGSFDGWMKEENTIIACCSDGLRPVVFEVQRIDD